MNVFLIIFCIFALTMIFGHLVNNEENIVITDEEDFVNDLKKTNKAKNKPLEGYVKGIDPIVPEKIKKTRRAPKKKPQEESNKEIKV